MLDVVTYPRYWTWLAGLPRDLAVEVEDSVEYLAEHGRGAVLPTVRHRIQQSGHFPDMSEVRVDRLVDGRQFVVRALTRRFTIFGRHGVPRSALLTCFVSDDKAVLICAAGDKREFEQRTGRDWYDAHVPVADHIAKHYITRGAP